MFFKSIIQGKLDFGSQKSYDKVVKMYQYRVETYYKNDLIFKLEEVFNPEDLSLYIERFVGNVTEKSFKNTADLLSYCAQFAVNGNVRAWLLDSGTILHFHNIEPESDKAAVQSYIKGKNLVKVEGKQDEAIAELSKAIEKYDRHAQAYERRAKTCFIMKMYKDALRDYNKALIIDPTIPTAYYGRARVHLVNKDFEPAIADFDQAVKKSVALEPIHWKGRRLKGYCHIMIKQYHKAIFELKLFTSRSFPADNPNEFWKRWAFFYYGVALMEVENYTEALAAFDAASKLEVVKDGVEPKDILRNRGICKQKSGKNGYIKDIKDAAALGDTIATSMLKEFA